MLRGEVTKGHDNLRMGFGTRAVCFSPVEGRWVFLDRIEPARAEGLWVVSNVSAQLFNSKHVICCRACCLQTAPCPPALIQGFCDVCS